MRWFAVLALTLALAACGNDNGRLQGWVEADFVFVGPDEAGRVETLAVREGDQVAAGAPLFAVDADLQHGRRAHRRRAGRRGARAARAAGSRRSSARRRSRCCRRRSGAPNPRLGLSTAELERQQSLAAKGIAAQAQLDIARANSNRDKAALEEVRRQITVAQLSSREEDIAAARQSLAAAQARQTASETKLARRKLSSPVSGAVQQVYYRPGEMVPAGRPVLSILPPGNIKLRFFVAQALLPKIALGDTVEVSCDGCTPLTARVSFIARAAEYTPPVIYSLEERNKLVFMIEARPEKPDGLRVGQPVQVALKGEAKK